MLKTADDACQLSGCCCGCVRSSYLAAVAAAGLLVIIIIEPVLLLCDLLLAALLLFAYCAAYITVLCEQDRLHKHRLAAVAQEFTCHGAVTSGC